MNGEGNFPNAGLSTNLDNLQQTAPETPQSLQIPSVWQLLEKLIEGPDCLPGVRLGGPRIGGHLLPLPGRQDLQF